MQSSTTQACDNRICFGVFKKEYYECIDILLQKRTSREMGATEGKTNAQETPGLVKQAWTTAITPNAVVKAYINFGICPGKYNLQKL